MSASNSQVLATVVVPTLGRRETVRLTLASLEPHAARISVVVVAPEDAIPNLRDLVVGTRLNLKIVAQRGTGQAGAILDGWEDAETPWVSWLNDDDIALPGTALLLDRCGENPEAAVLYGDILISKANVPSVVRYPNSVNARMLSGGACYVPGVLPLVRKNVVDSVQLSTRHDLAFDLEWWVQIVIAGHRICRVPAIAGMLVEHEGARTQEFSSAARAQAKDVLIKHYGRSATGKAALYRFASAAEARIRRVLP